MLFRSAQQEGWGAVPSGTRQSTYRNPAFLQANAHAAVEQEAIASANPLDATVPKSPYAGIQFVALPEFQSIGTAVGQMISELLQRPDSVDATLAKAQAYTDQRMRVAGFRY